MTRHFINGIEISPRNLDEIGFKCNFSDLLTNNENKILSLNVEEITLPNEGKKVVEDWLNTNGVFQGIPYQIKFGNTTLDYYIDLTEQATFRTYDCTVKIKKAKSYDNFKDLAQGQSFDLMLKNGINFDLFDVPYVIIPSNQIEQALPIYLAIFVMTKTAIEEAKKLGEMIQELISAFTPSVGLGAVLNVGDIAMAFVRIILQALYLIALIVMIKKLADRVAELIFPKVRNFKASYVRDLLSKFCESNGYKLKSTLLDSLSGLTILPVPLVKGKRKGFKSIFDYAQNDLNFAFTKGIPTSQDSTPTPWKLIEAIETTFNAQCRVYNGLVQIERRDFFKLNANAKLTTALKLQDSRSDEYQLNTFDSWKRYYITYQPDYSDTFTLDKFEYNDTEYSAELTNVIDKNLITLKGLQQRSIPFAMGNRKENLTYIEKIVKDLFKAIDKVAKTSYSSKIEQRKGVLTISQQYFSITKLLYTLGGKQVPGYYNKIGSNALYQNYHAINEIQVNGYKIRQAVKTLMNEDIFVNLLENNWCEIDGKMCEILDLEYKTNDSYALITYREPYNYAKNIKTIKLDD